MQCRKGTTVLLVVKVQWSEAERKKCQHRIIRNSTHLFKSSSQCKSKLMRLNVPDTGERQPMLHSNTKNGQNSHANFRHTSNNFRF